MFSLEVWRLLLYHWSPHGGLISQNIKFFYNCFRNRCWALQKHTVFRIRVQLGCLWIRIQKGKKWPTNKKEVKKISLKGWSLLLYLRCPHGAWLPKTSDFFTTASGTAVGLCQRNRISESGFNWGFVDKDPRMQKWPTNKKKSKKFSLWRAGGFSCTLEALMEAWPKTSDLFTTASETAAGLCPKITVFRIRIQEGKRDPQ